MNLTQSIQEILSSHNLMHLATIDSNGMPHVRGVNYVSGKQDNVLFFITHKTSRKVGHIRNNKNVSVVIDHDCPTWDDLTRLKYMKGSGVATILDGPNDIQSVFGMIIAKFPFLKNLPGDPTDFVAAKVELQEVYLTDNTISFGHTEKVDY